MVPPSSCCNKRYDPNHLILGDKHDVGYGNNVHKIPDGVLSAIGTFTDVLMIQSYTHYGAHHQLMLNELYENVVYRSLMETTHFHVAMSIKVKQRVLNAAAKKKSPMRIIHI